MKNTIDHIAVGAANLEHGVRSLKSLLGVDIPSGGKHDQMSTHNCLAQAGEQQFFELISIDPAAPAPGRVRWFTLDNPETQARLRQRPRALCWAVNTTNLDKLVASSPVDLGEVITVSRGDLSWRLTVPKDGSLLEAGLLPAFIEWAPGPHPSQSMQNVGINLRSVNLGHPDPAYLQGVLETLSVAHLATVHKHESRVLSFNILCTKTGTADRDITID